MESARNLRFPPYGLGLAAVICASCGAKEIGLTAKNAILIVGAALEGTRLRLLPILMTSFAFILGCVPLWTTKGAGAVGRVVLGTSVTSGMLAANILGVVLVPVFFVVAERLTVKKEKKHPEQQLKTAHAEGAAD
jgi:HAE1 family hydrophobic/amphiphilic exporter-1